MQCFYCHASNEEDALRCSRCGRRAANPSAYRSVSNLAYALQPEAAAKSAPKAEAARFPAPAQPEAPAPEEAQPWLFRASDVVGRPKVVPIPVLTPRLDGPARKPRGPRGPRRPRAAGDDLQHLLDLQEAVEPSQPRFDAMIDCDAPVAPAPQRIAAAMVDGALIGCGVLLFLTMFYMAGGSLGFDKMSALIVLGSSLSVSGVYRMLWCLGCGDSPGTRSAGMRVVNFDGRPPNRSQRGLRMAAGALSVLSAGLGLIWVLVDEEKLAWHDHISKTFPTPV